MSVRLSCHSFSRGGSNKHTGIYLVEIRCQIIIYKLVYVVENHSITNGSYRTITCGGTVNRVKGSLSSFSGVCTNIISKLVLRFPHDKDSPLGAQNKN